MFRQHLACALVATALYWQAGDAAFNLLGTRVLHALGQCPNFESKDGQFVAQAPTGCGKCQTEEGTCKRVAEKAESRALDQAGSTGKEAEI